MVKYRQSQQFYNNEYKVLAFNVFTNIDDVHLATDIAWAPLRRKKMTKKIVKVQNPTFIEKKFKV